jgi:peptidoglycan/LPS O-acetylase OafA/YrhL
MRSDTATRTARPGLAFVTDVACLLLFSAVGRRSHNEGLTIGGLLTTLWPFLAGLVAAWLAGRLWRAPNRVAPTGLVAWVGALILGMLLRAASRQGVQLAFVIVAAIVLAVLLLGWRALAAAIGGGIRRAGSGSPSS